MADKLLRAENLLLSATADWCARALSSELLGRFLTVTQGSPALAAGVGSEEQGTTARSKCSMHLCSS